MTKWQVYNWLQDELYNSLPQVALDCDVSVDEAHCDKFTKDYEGFHNKESENFNLSEINIIE